MSNNSFHIGNATFRAVIAKLTPLCAPSTPFFWSCHLAGIRPPQSDAEATDFSKKCINSLKKKADLLAKLLPGNLKRTQALNLVANICFFQSWKSLQDYADAFQRLSGSQRDSSGDSFKLSLALWRLTPNRLDEFTSTCIKGSGDILSNTQDLEPEQAYDIVIKVFLDRDLISKTGCINEAELLEITRLMHRRPIQHLLMAILSRVPVRGVSVARWPDLSNITVGMLLRKVILFEAKGEILPLEAENVFASDIMGSVHAFSSANYGYYMNPTQGFLSARKEADRIITALAHEDSRQAAENLAESMIKPYLGKTVLEAVTLTESTRGFYSSNIPKSVDDAANKYGDPVSKIETHIAGVKISIFVSEPFDIISNEGCRVFNISTLAHDNAGDVLGFAEFFYAHNPSGKIYDLGMLADEIEVNECIELTVSMADKVGGKFSQALNNVVYVTSWEVARKMRRMGLGKLLLNTGFEIGMANLTPPDYVLSRIHPSEYPVPITDGVDPDLIPNYGDAVSATWNAWDAATEGGSKFGRFKSGFYPGGYVDFCHGHPNIMMHAMAYYTALK